MNHESALPLVSAVIDHIVVAPYDALRAVVTRLVAQWRDHAARRRELREFDAIVGSSVRMLKDIGAPSWMIARAAARRDTTDPWLVQPGAAP